MRLSHLATTAVLSTLILATPVIAKDKKPQDPDKRVCRSEVPTGSLMGKSVCHTVAQWSAIDHQNEANTDTMMGSQRTASH
jgi:hypothetical protein